LVDKWIPPSRSEIAEIGKKTKGILGVKEEQLILASKHCVVDHPQGLNNCMVIFCLRNFFIRGHSELRATSPNQFEVGVNIRGDEYLRYVLSVLFSFCSFNFCYYLLLC
jgi:hypothetical protein